MSPGNPFILGSKGRGRNAGMGFGTLLNAGFWTTNQDNKVERIPLTSGRSLEQRQADYPACDSVRNTAPLHLSVCCLVCEIFKHHITDSQQLSLINILPSCPYETLLA